jgi:hypothetical protein
VEGCSYKTLHKHNMTKHVNTVHAKSKDFICEECGFATSRKESLKNHVDVIHNGVYLERNKKRKLKRAQNRAGLLLEAQQNKAASAAASVVTSPT